MLTVSTVQTVDKWFGRTATSCGQSELENTICRKFAVLLCPIRLNNTSISYHTVLGGICIADFALLYLTVPYHLFTLKQTQGATVK